MRSFVHRYKDSHTDLRKQARRLAKDGLIALLEQRRDGFLYDITGYEVTIRKHKPQLRKLAV
jgi:hypothetical protein